MDQIEVTASFGDNPLWTRHFPAGDLAIGDGETCDFPGLPCAIVRIDGPELMRRRRVEIAIEKVRITASLAPAERLARAPLAARVDAAGALSWALSAIVHATVLTAFALLFPPRVASGDVSRDQLLAMRAYLAHAAERDAVPIAPAPVVHGPACRTLPIVGGGGSRREARGSGRATAARATPRAAPERAVTALDDAAEFGVVALAAQSTCDAGDSAIVVAHEPDAWPTLAATGEVALSDVDSNDNPSFGLGGGTGGGGGGWAPIGLGPTPALGVVPAVPIGRCVRRVRVVAPDAAAHARRVTVTGAADAAEVRAVVRRSEPELARCARGAPPGTITVALLVARDGSVAGARDAGSDVADAAVRACVLGVFEKMVFAPSSHGTATIAYSP